MCSGELERVRVNGTMHMNQEGWGEGEAHPKQEYLACWGYFLFPDAEPSEYFSLLPKCLPFSSLAQHPSPSLTHHKHKSSYLLALTHLVFDL